MLKRISVYHKMNGTSKRFHLRLVVAPKERNNRKNTLVFDVVALKKVIAGLNKLI